MLIDVIVYFHLLFVALGLGLAVRLDFLFFRGRHARPSGILLADAALSHQMISTALVGLWGTGLMMVYLRTGFVLDQFTPKLWMKLIIVSALSVNAIVIGGFVMPVMARYDDRPVLAIPLRYKLPMAVSAATSVFCWFMALALGAMATLKTQTWDMLLPVLGLEYIFGLMVAVSVALFVRAPKSEPNGTADPLSVDSAPDVPISRPSIGVGGPRKRNPVATAKSVERTTPFAK